MTVRYHLGFNNWNRGKHTAPTSTNIGAGYHQHEMFRANIRPIRLGSYAAMTNQMLHFTMQHLSVRLVFRIRIFIRRLQSFH